MNFINALSVEFPLIIWFSDIIAIAFPDGRLLQNRIVIYPCFSRVWNEHLLCLNGCCGKGKQQCAESDCCETFIYMSFFHARVILICKSSQNLNKKVKISDERPAIFYQYFRYIRK